MSPTLFVFDPHATYSIHTGIPHPVAPSMPHPPPLSLHPGLPKSHHDHHKAPTQPKTKKAQNWSKAKGKATQNPPHPTTTTQPTIERPIPPCALCEFLGHPTFHFPSTSRIERAL
jgi:hypothetical protein